MAKGGIVMGLVLGIAALVIATIIAFVIVQNVALVDDDIATSIGTNITNETGFYLNGTNYSVAWIGVAGFDNFDVYLVINASSGATVADTNYTFGTDGYIWNDTAWGPSEVYVSYTFSREPTKASADRMINNFTLGVDKVSGKVPTILLIAAVVLVLGILALLWSQYQKMNIGSGGDL